MASSSSVSVFDNYRFKTAFNEELYNSIVKNKKISLRGWRRLAAPKQEISIDLIHEFYANAILTEEEMEEAGGHTFRSYVRGKVVDFSPENLRNVMRFRAHVQGAATDFETRKEHDQQLDQVLADLCIPGATWKLSTGKLRVPIQLRRQELNPVARGWHEFSIHSLIPSSNRSEIPGIKEKGKLGFPRTIFKLCKEAGRRQQKDEKEDEPMPQAEEGNEEGNEGQAHDYDYHHQPEYEHPQPDYEQPQPDFEHHQEFNEPPNMMWYQQQALENMSKNQAEYMAELRDIKRKQQELYENNDRFYNQVRQEQKEMVQEIQQIKNYQVNQTLVDSTRHKAYMDELAAMKAKQEEFFSNQVNQYNLIRQDHKLLGKEILDAKKYQMSAVTMGSDGSSSSTQPPPPPPPYEPDQALMKIREQHATFTEICRQLKDWTRNASGRESYMVWAYQLANPNLPPNPAPPTSSSKDPQDPASSSKDPKDPPK
ncbi:hypothetical protein PIB30_087871 [Stylosanthes scabra]|uniref:Putative plant transposon protein domain-containing protein n=1 Tax=Stylosanthes scabra TaxID=79078 RepID=A0ABU6QTL8_9FABA|nr:hypothetical protein [Stylosanthes scabra]